MDFLLKPYCPFCGSNETTLLSVPNSTLHYFSVHEDCRHFICSDCKSTFKVVYDPTSIIPVKRYKEDNLKAKPFIEKNLSSNEYTQKSITTTIPNYMD